METSFCSRCSDVLGACDFAWGSLRSLCWALVAPFNLSCQFRELSFQCFSFMTFSSLFSQFCLSGPAIVCLLDLLDYPSTVLHSFSPFTPSLSTLFLSTYWFYDFCIILVFKSSLIILLFHSCLDNNPLLPAVIDKSFPFLKSFLFPAGFCFLQVARPHPTFKFLSFS